MKRITSPIGIAVHSGESAASAPLRTMLCRVSGACILYSVHN